MSTVKVQAPMNSKPGDLIQVIANGATLQVGIPDGVQPGGYFLVPIPDQALPVATSVATSVVIAPAVQDMKRDNEQESLIVAQPSLLMAQPALVGEPQLVGGNGPQPFPILGDGSLVSVLERMSACRIEQKVDIIEAFGIESPNQYKVFAIPPDNFNDKSLQVMHITESGNFCERQCCGSFRSCELQIRRGDNKMSPVIARMTKDFHMNLCFVFMRPRARIVDHNNALLSSIYDPFACLTANQYTYDAAGNHTYTLIGSLCQSAAWCPCSDFEFDIIDPSGQPCGKMIKLFNGCEELMLDVNHFVIVFPPNATPEQKAGILAGTFLLDFQFFETDKDNNSNNN